MTIFYAFCFQDSIWFKDVYLGKTVCFSFEWIEIPVSWVIWVLQYLFRYSIFFNILKFWGPLFLVENFLKDCNGCFSDN